MQGLNLLVPSLSAFHSRAAFGPKAMQWLREGFTKVFARGVRVWGVGYDSGRHHYEAHRQGSAFDLQGLPEFVRTLVLKVPYYDEAIMEPKPKSHYQGPDARALFHRKVPGFDKDLRKLDGCMRNYSKPHKVGNRTKAK